MVVGVGDNLKIRSCVLVEYLLCGEASPYEVWAGRWRPVQPIFNIDYSRFATEYFLFLSLL